MTTISTACPRNHDPFGHRILRRALQSRRRSSRTRRRVCGVRPSKSPLGFHGLLEIQLGLWAAGFRTVHEFVAIGPGARALSELQTLGDRFYRNASSPDANGRPGAPPGLTSLHSRLTIGRAPARLGGAWLLGLEREAQVLEWELPWVCTPLELMGDFYDESRVLQDTRLSPAVRLRPAAFFCR